MWQPDGAGRIARIGVLTPHLDPVPESEFYTMAPTGISVHAARVPLGLIGPDGEIVPHVGPEVPKAFAQSPALADAAALLMPLKPSAIIYAFTSSSYILGADADSELKGRLEDRTDGVPVVIQSQSLAAALRTLERECIALFHPPWFSTELDALGAKFFMNQGFEVAYHGPARLRGDYGDITPKQLFDWAKPRVPDNAQAIVLGGGGLRAIGVIEALEQSLGRPVLSANQASFWSALRIAHIDAEVVGYGQLFQI